MRKILAVLLILPIVACVSWFGTTALAADYPSVPPTFQDGPEVLFSPEQLDNLLAPIALYPDPLLAQVVVAATFPDQIDAAARFLRAGADPRAIDTQPWDVSVKAVTHYPTVLYMMADNLDWTASLGQAYVDQSTDVMAAVQRLRVQARAAGYLVSTPQMQVVEEGGSIALWPAQPQTLYVPVYDPALVFYHHGGYRPSTVISFSLGFAIGAWLNYDFDWHRHRVYYHGWEPRRGWIRRYRPHLHVTNVYVNKRYANVRINRTVVHRRVNYGALSRYNAVHRRVRYDNVRARRHEAERRGVRRGRGAPGNRRDVHNKIIRRNFDPGDPRIDANRGRWSDRPGPSRVVRPAPPRRQPAPRVDRPVHRQQQRQIRRQSDRSRPTREKVRPTPSRRHAVPQRQARPAPRQPETQADRPGHRQQQRQMQRRDYSAFRGRRTDIDPRAARQRGQSSRRLAERSGALAEPTAPRRRAPSHRRGNVPDTESGRGLHAPQRDSGTMHRRGPRFR